MIDAPLTKFRRAHVSYNRAEWWYPHLVTALSAYVEIALCPMVRANQPGHAPESDLAALLRGGKDDDVFYLGSIDQLFTGLSTVSALTAVWTDCLLPASLKYFPAYRLFDVIFSTQKDSIEPLRAAGNEQVEWLPFAFDSTLRNEPSTAKVYDVAFVGSLDLPPTRAERRAILDGLERKYVLNDYRVPVFGDEMMRTYNQARLVVNIPSCGGLNMRTFEALASGALLLTKDVANGQRDLFKDGEHLITYSDAADLEDKVAYFLRADREREGIAAAGSALVIGRHTYHHRAVRLLEIMDAARPARARDRRSEIAAYRFFYQYIDRPDLLARLAFSPGVGPVSSLELVARSAARQCLAALRQRRDQRPRPATAAE